MTANKTRIPGCFELVPMVRNDKRGAFIKTYNVREYEELGLRITVAEEYYSRSCRGVIRGMHFQTPPHGHVKTVTCIAGRAIDVVLDLRKGSPTYGLHESFRLNADSPVVLWIPEGCAHGFGSLEDGTVLEYRTSSVQSPAHEKGIHFGSFGFDWPVDSPILSDRDSGLPALAEFDSPFDFVEGPAL
jgi:dTDP-4-dehydrorhamnose 3,5-epimerase